MDLVVDETKNGAVMQIWGEDKKVFIEYPKHTISTFGDINMVFNNAGICDEEKWENTIQINLVMSFNFKIQIF